MAKDVELVGPEFAEMWEDDGEPVSTLLSSRRLSNYVILSGATEAASLDERVDQGAETAAAKVPTRGFNLEQPSQALKKIQ